jgi:hypothetical protein
MKMTTLAVLALLVGAVAAPGAAQQSAADWTLEPDLRIGSLDGRDDAFGSIRSLAPGPDGTIAVLDAFERTVRVFDEDGRLLRRLGRPGDGPAEFRLPMRVGWLADTLWVSDARLERITYFGARGELLETHPYSPSHWPPGAPVAAGSVMLTTDGAVTIVTEASGTWDPQPELTAAYVETDRMGTVRDVLHTFQMPNPMIGMVPPVAGRPRPVEWHRFQSRPTFAIDPLRRHGVHVERTVAATATEGLFHVTRATFEGDTLFSVSFQFTPREITPAEVDEAVNMLAMNWQRYGSEEAARRAIRSQLVVPRFAPAVTGVTLAPEGQVWLERERLGNRTVWNVVDIDGSMLAVVTGPASLRSIEISGDHVWGIERDELGIGHVARYRIRR